MKSPYLIYCFLSCSFLTFCAASNASAQYQPADSSSLRSATVLTLAQLIEEHAVLTGGALGVRYTTHVTAPAGLKLYVSEHMRIFGGPSDPDLYYIDFEQPIKAKDLQMVRSKKGYFALEASKRITKKVKRRVRNGQLKERERNARLYIFFTATKKKRTVDYDQLHTQVTELINQLIEK